MTPYMDGAYPYMDLNAKYGKLLLRCLQLTFSRENSAKKMESEKEKCGNCGKTFALKGKSYDRKSFNANLKLKIIDKTIKRFVYEFTSISKTRQVHVK